MNLPTAKTCSILLMKQARTGFSRCLSSKKYALLIDNDTGVIRGIDADASRFYPVGRSVVDIDTIPTGCDAAGGWMYSKGKIVVYAAKAQEEASRTKNG